MKERSAAKTSINLILSRTVSHTAALFSTEYRGDTINTGTFARKSSLPKNDTEVLLYTHFAAIHREEKGKN